MKFTKFKSNKEAIKHLRANGKYNSNNELVLNEGVKTLLYPNTNQDKVSLKINIDAIQ